MYRKFSVIILVGSLISSAWAEPQTFSSGPGRVGTLELFTSQGCSSCPPAEEFLNQLRESPGLWKEFIPLAFHVDYWNYLGWRDRFSSADYSLRQRQYARTLGMRTVYTPGFFADGREWRRGFSNSLPDFKHNKVGNLTVSVEKEMITGKYDAIETAGSGLMVNTALLGMGLSTDIRSGERAGHKTDHEFVVLGHAQQALRSSDFTMQLPKPIVAAKTYAVVVWLNKGADPTPVQTTGGLLK